MKAFITMMLIFSAAPLGAAGIAHANTDVQLAWKALMHQPTTAFDSPNQATQELERVYGMEAHHADALVGQLIVLNRNDPANWRPSQTCFDLWHQGALN